MLREIDEQMEVDDPEVIERRIKRDQKRNAWLMRSIAKDISKDIVNRVCHENKNHF